MTARSMILMLALLPLAAFAQQSPVGKWKTIDDKTGKPKSIVEISTAQDGSLSGKVLTVLQSDKGPHPVCDACTGERHNQPVEGMVILWGVKQDGATWDDGRIVDPHNGKEYSVKLTPSGDQAKDPCGTMTITNQLVKSSSGGTNCW